jgi:hypothetical protein
VLRDSQQVDVFLGSGTCTKMFNFFVLHYAPKLFIVSPSAFGVEMKVSALIISLIIIKVKYKIVLWYEKIIHLYSKLFVMTSVVTATCVLPHD